MSAALKPEAEPAPMTTVQFDRWLDAQRGDGRWELIDGRVVAMVPPLIVHALVVRNLGDALTAGLGKRTCTVFRGDVGVQAADDENRTYRPIPDITVQCGALDLNARFVADPLVVCEVLSPSTMDDDRGVKLGFYKTIRTLRHIVLVYADQIRVEHYRRAASGWPVEALTEPDAALMLDGLGVTIPLSAIYDGIDLTAIAADGA